MKLRKKKLNPHKQKKKEKSTATNWLLAIFFLLLLWFLIWLLDWLDELFGLSTASKVRNAAASKGYIVGGEESTIQTYNTIEYQPIQHVVEQIGSFGYVYRQSAPSAVWTIEHKWGYVPTVMTYDETGQEIKGQVNPTIIQTWIEEYQDYQYTVEVFTITFSEPVSGFAVFP